MVGGVDADRLDPEPAERVQAGIEGEHGPGTHPVCGAAHEPHEHAEHREIPQRLVQERRLERLPGHVGRQRMVDPDRPRQAAGMAVQLLVRVVADAPERLGEDEAGGRAVGHCPERQPHDPAAERGAEHAAQDPAVDPQAAPPDPEHVGRDLLVRRPVGGDVLDAGANESGHHCTDGDREDQFGIEAAGAEPAPRHPHRRHDGGGQQEPVPARLEPTELEDEGISRAGY